MCVVVQIKPKDILNVTFQMDPIISVDKYAISQVLRD